MRCWLTACCVRAKLAAICPAGISVSRTSRTISRRCGSASARRTASGPAGLSGSPGADITTPFSWSPGAPWCSTSGVDAERMSLPGVDVGDQAGQHLRPARRAVVVALELRDEPGVAERETGALAGRRQVEHHGGALPLP